VQGKQKDTLKILSLVSLLLLLVVVSQEMNGRFEKSQSVSEAWELSGNERREIASSQLSRGLNWERELARSLNREMQERETASIGGVRSISGLTLGELAGNYRIVTQPDYQGRVFVRELEFVEGVESAPKPIVLTNTKDFLNKNSYLFGLGESYLELKTSDPSQESYQSKTLDGKGVGIRVEKDGSGRLLRLSIQVE